MIKKMANIIKTEGLLSFFTLLIKRVFIIFGLEISIRKTYGPNPSIKRKIFGGRLLSYDNDGFWFIDPMPTKNDLDEYYSSSYWGFRDDKKEIMNGRDIIHFLIFKDQITGFNNKNINFLNFGAGHGGISHLMWMNGHNVINIEPGGIDNYYDERWQTFQSIDDVESDTIDFVYGSHSLEHVQNISEIHLKVMKVLKDGGYIFWEVPNGNKPGEGPHENEIHIPHTYYYTKEYFDKKYKNIILNEVFDQSHIKSKYSDWKNYTRPSNVGEVIRVIAQK